MKEVFGDRNILEMLRIISSDRETAKNKNDIKLAVYKDREFFTTSKYARRLNYSNKDILRADLLGRIHSCMESGESEMEYYYKEYLQDLN